MSLSKATAYLKVVSDTFHERKLLFNKCFLLHFISIILYSWSVLHSSGHEKLSNCTSQLGNTLILYLSKPPHKQTLVLADVNVSIQCVQQLHLNGNHLEC